jgi:hypothetical protein
MSDEEKKYIKEDLEKALTHTNKKPNTVKPLKTTNSQANEPDTSQQNQRRNRMICKCGNHSIGGFDLIENSADSTKDKLWCRRCGRMIIKGTIVEPQYIIDQQEHIKNHITGVVIDLVSNFLYYNRKEDEDLPVGAIEKAIKDNIVSVKEIVDLFQQELINYINKE